MAREIKFRGKNKFGWHYGYFSKDYAGNCWITSINGEDTHLVDESTIGQFHNALSKKTEGQEVYVGDEISFDLTAGLGEPPSYGHKELVSTVERCATWYTNVKVIGNVHESEVTNG